MEGQKVQDREEPEASVGITRTEFERILVGDIRAAGLVAIQKPTVQEPR